MDQESKLVVSRSKKLKRVDIKDVTKRKLLQIQVCRHMVCDCPDGAKGRKKVMGLDPIILLFICE